MTRRQLVARALEWYDDARTTVAYRGTLADARALTAHVGYDGWQDTAELALERVTEGLHVASLPLADGRIVADVAVTDGQRWDNNEGMDYRLWLHLDPVDAHTHVDHRGEGSLGLQGLRSGMASAGVTRALVSWRDNAAVRRLTRSAADLAPLVWVHPGHTSVHRVGHHLATDHVGIKLHPVVDHYPADDHRLDRYMELAATHDRPVVVHSSPGPADPDLVRRLAERWPTVPVVLYHVYLGPDEGRHRAAAHVREVANLYLETSWCRWELLGDLVAAAGPDRVLFGSDAAIDGAHHYAASNVEGRESYKHGMLALAHALCETDRQLVFERNASRLFRLGHLSRDHRLMTTS